MAVLLLAVMGCQADQKPQPIEAHDVCASCKMAISETRYAAQVVDKEGSAHKFDDIGCMLRYRREHKLPQARIYVMDYVDRQWLEAESAVFLRSGAIASPMASGLAAFRDRVAAQQFLKGSSGQITSFSDLTSNPASARPASEPR